jgi:choline kinase
MKNIKGGIIAAGQGLRFKQGGVDVPKALISVDGKPLLGWSLSRFIETGIEKMIVIFNRDNCEPCTTYIHENFSDIALEIICKNTVSSFESFYEVLLRGKNEHLLITTVDSIFKPRQFTDFLRFAHEVPRNALVLGISGFIDDEKPLYVTLDNNRRIISLGRDKSEYVTSGVYFLHSSLIHNKKQKNYSSLRLFLKDMVEQGVPTYGFSLGKTIDVDHPHDLDKAEELVASSGNHYKKA